MPSWAKVLLTVFSNGEPVAMPPGASMANVRGDGFRFYDTGQEHIITDSTFRNCGYRSEVYNQYDKKPSTGCKEDCTRTSAVWGFRIHSDQHVPEIVQTTVNITYENCGRRFFLFSFKGPNSPVTVSGRGQVWIKATL